MHPSASLRSAAPLKGSLGESHESTIILSKTDEHKIVLFYSIRHCLTASLIVADMLLIQLSPRWQMLAFTEDYDLPSQYLARSWVCAVRACSMSLCPS